MWVRHLTHCDTVTPCVLGEQRVTMSAWENVKGINGKTLVRDGTKSLLLRWWDGVTFSFLNPLMVANINDVGEKDLYVVWLGKPSCDDIRCQTSG